MSEPNSRERACFEAGIKFGSLYHQFAGTPVSRASAGSLERAIAESITNQPHCERVEVTIDRDRLKAAADATHGYTELTGELYDCEIVVAVDGARATAELVHVDGYPEMRIVRLSGPD